MPRCEEERLLRARVRKWLNPALHHSRLPSLVADAEAAAYMLERDQLFSLLRRVGRLLIDMEAALQQPARRSFKREFTSVLADAYPFVRAHIRRE